MAAALESRNTPPTQLGRYALFDQIAQGGMATVHLGRLVGPVGFSKIVAIKQMHESAAQNPEFVAMFLDEARLSGRVQHPNVVATFDVIAHSGEAFLVMEYVHGESLSALLRAARTRNERPSPEIAVHVLCDVLYGLHAAHEASDENGEQLLLVHRDISPQNIIVGVDGVARVLDFGIAKAAGRLQETQNGQLKGKLGYMAPEQLLGRPLDRRVDIFAAGIVLWEFLSGRKLFDADNSGQLMYQVLETEIPPLDSFMDLPPALARAVERATSREVNERFATAQEFARELENSTQLVSTRRVGDWVTSLCGEALARRYERLKAIEATPLDTAIVRRTESLHERDSFHPAGSDAMTEPAQEPVRIIRPRSGPHAIVTPLAPRPDATGVTAIASEPVPAPRHRWRGAVVGGIALLLGAGYLLLHKTEREQTPSAAATPTAAVGATPSAALAANQLPASPTGEASSAATLPALPATALPSVTATATSSPRRAGKKIAPHPAARRPEDLFSRQ